MLHRFEYKLGGLMVKITEQSTRFDQQTKREELRMKYLIVLVLAVSAVVAVDPKCAYRNLIEGYTMEDILANAAWPDSIDDQNENCDSNMMDGLSFIEQYNEDCVKNPLTEQITGKMRKALVRIYNDICFEDGLNRFVNRSKECYNKPPVFNKLAEINTRFVGLVEKLATYEKKQQLPIYCCAALYLDHGVTNLPVEDCGQVYQDKLGLELKSMFLKPFKKICHGKSDYLACINTTLNDAQKRDFLNIINVNPPVTIKYTTVLPTLYKVMDNN